MLSKHLQISRKVLAYFIAIMILFSGSIGYLAYNLGFTSAQSVTLTQNTLTGGMLVGAPAYTIFLDGSTYCAKNRWGAVSFSGTSAAVVASNAIAALDPARLAQAKILFVGDIHTTATINVTSFTNIVIDGVIYLENGANCNVFTATNTYCVTFEGGAINGNKAGQTGTSNAISVSDSTIIAIQNMYIANAFLAGVYTHNVNSSKISGCIFKDDGSASTEMSGSIYWDGGEHNSIVGNNFDDGSYADIMCADWIHPINDFTITGNEMINSFFGIVYCGNMGTITGNKLQARTPCDAGIYLNGRGNQGDINTVSGNTISGHMDGIGLEDSYSCAITGNTIYATWGGHGIYVFGATYSTNNTIVGNSMFNVAKNGILLWNASFNVVNDNRIADVNNDIAEGTFCGINATNNAFSNIYVGDYVDVTGAIIVPDVNSHAVACWNSTGWTP